MREELKNFTLYLPKEKGQTQQAVVFVFSSTSAKAVSLSSSHWYYGFEGHPKRVERNDGCEKALDNSLTNVTVCPLTR